MKKSIYTLLIGLISLSMSASHILGGELSYEQTASNKYKLILKLYRDVTGVGLGNTQTVIETSLNSNNLTHSLSISSTKIVNSGCGQSIEINTYEKEITITTVPASGLVFYWSSCCRPAGISNMTGSSGQGFYVEAKMFPRPGTTMAGNSPRFLNPPTIGLTSNGTSTLNNFAIDPDAGDSVYVIFSAPKELATIPVNIPLDTGFTYQMPFDTNTATTIDPSNGMITVTSPNIGRYAYALRIQSYVNGVLNSVVRRDVFASVSNYNVVKPSLSLNQVQVKGGSYTSSGNQYSFNIQERGEINFDFSGAFAAGSTDTLELFASGQMLDTSIGGSCSGNFCASFIPTSGSFVGSGNVSALFNFIPDTNFVSGFGSRTTSFVLEARMKDSCNVAHSEIVTVSVTVNGTSMWSDEFRHYICQGGSAQAQLYGDTSNVLWSPAIGVSNVNSSSPVLTPSASILYNVMNLNDSSSIQIEVQVDSPIPNFSLNFNGVEASIPASIPHTSVIWMYNGTPILVDQDTIPIYLSGSYYALIENAACSQVSDTLKINMKNQAQSSNSSGTAIAMDSISKVTFSISYNLGENDLTHINFVLPEEGIYKTSTINQVEIYDFSVSSTPIATASANKVNDFIWSTSTLNVHLIGGRLYQFVVYLNDSKMPLFSPDSIPYIDENNFLTFAWSTINKTDGTVVNDLIPYMTFKFVSSIGIEEVQGIDHNIYPNPFTNQLNIETEGLNTFVLMDGLGRVILTKEYTSQLNVNTLDLASGVYLYQINGTNGNASGKLIKK